MSTSDASLARFIEITSTSPSQAQFYLDSAGGDLDAAVAQFFESGGNDDAAVGSAELPGGGAGASAGGQSAPAPTPAAPPQSGAYTLSGAPVEGLPAGWGSSGGGGSGSGSGRSTPRNPLRSNAGPRITGFRDLASSSGPSSGGRGGGDSDDEEGGRRRDPQQFFAGGARSGLSVENPNNNTNQGGSGGGGVNDMIQGLLQRATEGSQRLASRRAQEEEEQARPQFFGGSAHTLGSDETPSTYIPDPTRSSGNEGEDEEEEEEEEQETAIRHLTFWQDGFSIEDGDLLKYEENQELLAAIQSGRAPLSLLNVRFDQPVELRIAERRNERWVRQPPPPQGPFAGSGNRLGSASPFPAASSSSGAGTMPGSFGGSGEKGGASGSGIGGGGESAGGETVFEVDRNEPTTQVQIRLRSGERMIATFNHTHTVGDIRRYINASSPSNASPSYVLQTTFPSRDLTDESQTIKEAGVAGSVVVQRPI